MFTNFVWTHARPSSTVTETDGFMPSPQLHFSFGLSLEETVQFLHGLAWQQVTGEA